MAKVKICRPWKILPNGRKIWAKWYGYKAFCFYVEDKMPETKKPFLNK